MVKLNALFKLSPAIAIKYFKSKNNKLSWDWYELWQSAHRKSFTVAKAMLGRYCLSGNLTVCTDEIYNTIKQSIEFYEHIKPIIKKGTTTVIDTKQMTSFLAPKGTTHLIRESLDGSEKVVYAYAIDAPLASLEIEVGDYILKNSYNAPADLKVAGGKVYLTAGDCAMWGTVLHFVKK